MTAAATVGEERFWSLAERLLTTDGVEPSTMMGLPCLRIHGAFFASCDRRTGHLLVKLPESRVDELVASGRAQTFAPAGRRFRQSQMGPEDMAMLRAVHGSTALHPCDANQTAQLVAAMADHPGIAYLRTLRGATPVVYPPGEGFDVGGSRVLRSSDNDRVVIAAAGITVHEAPAAADTLARDHGIPTRVIDAYSIKPIDRATLRAAIDDTGASVITVEDHWAEGGLGDAVAAALADTDQPPRVVKLAVRDMPGSGTPAELLAAAGIDANAIVACARELATQTHDE
jgi:transketolase C-terminal domain/subunit